MLDGAGGDAADAFGFAAVVSERKLVEVGLQMFRLDRARVRAVQPALQQRHCPVDGLQRVLDLALGLGLHDWLVRACAEALLL